MSLTIYSKDTNLASVAARILHGIATKADFESIGVDNVLAVKTDRDVVHYRYGYEGIEKADGAASRKRKFIASSQRVDRMGDVIMQRGWDFTDFEPNPMALAYHDHQMPIGLVCDWKIGRKDGTPVLRESIDFAEQSVLPFADEILRAVDAKVLRAVSVGFIAIKGRFMTEEDRKEHGIPEENASPWAVLFEKQGQIELSVCTVPAHPDALAEGKALAQRIDDETWALAESGEISDATARLLCDWTAKTLDVSTRTIVTVPDLRGTTDDTPLPHAAKSAPVEPAAPTGDEAAETPATDVLATLTAAIARYDAASASLVALEAKTAQNEQRLAQLESEVARLSAALASKSTTEGGGRAAPRADLYERAFDLVSKALS